MKKFKEWLIPIIIITILSIIVLLVLFKEPDKIYVEPKVIDIIESKNDEEKEKIREIKTEIRYIENSKEYTKLRHIIDSLIITKDTSSFATTSCYKVVIVQDSIIHKQKEVITIQDRVIENDSIIKLQLKETISEKNEELKKSKKDNKKSLWRGRGEGFIVGGIIGFVVGKSF